LLVISRGGHRLVFQDDLFHGPVAVPRMADSDGPTFLVRRRPQRVNTARTGGDQGRADSGRLEDRHHPADSITLADPAGVQFGARTEETYGLLLRVQLKIPVADPAQHASHLSPVRQPAGTLVESPDPHQGAD